MFYGGCHSRIFPREERSRRECCLARNVDGPHANGTMGKKIEFIAWDG